MVPHILKWRRIRPCITLKHKQLSQTLNDVCAGPQNRRCLTSGEYYISICGSLQRAAVKHWLAAMKRQKGNEIITWKFDVGILDIAEYESQVFDIWTCEIVMAEELSKTFPGSDKNLLCLLRIKRLDATCYYVKSAFHCIE